MASLKPFGELSMPVVASPMFIISSPKLVVAQCKAGIVGTMPSLNVREADALDATLAGIQDALDRYNDGGPGRPAAPFGINLIAHKSNARLQHDLDVCVARKVPLIITSLGPSAAIVERVHAYGGQLFHDVINVRHAMKAAQAGVDGVIAVAAGAGGHGGTISPFALCSEIRSVFEGVVALAGSVSTGGDIAACRAMGADMAYVGTRMIATEEANASAPHKQMILESGSADILYSPYFSGVPGNYLRSSIVAQGLDPDALPSRDKDTMHIDANGSKAKAWKDIWSAGHGVGAIRSVPTVAQLIDQWRSEYRDAVTRITQGTQQA